MSKGPPTKTRDLRVFVASGLFLALAVGGIGAFSYRANVIEQRELYQQYLALNSWKPKVQQAYAPFIPLLDRVEHLPPDKPDEAELNRLRLELTDRGEAVKKTPGLVFAPPIGDFHNFSKDIYELIRGYDSYLGVIYSLNHLSDPKARLASANLAVIGSRVGAARYRYSGPVTSEQISKELAAGDAVLKRDALSEIRSELASRMYARAKLEQSIYPPDVVPEGLNLAFARKFSAPD